MNVNSIYNEDCIAGMRTIPDNFVDLVVTDPPYKCTPRGGSGTMSGYWTNSDTKKGRIFQHNDVEIEDYLPELFRVLKADAHCYIMCNNLNLPHFFDVINKSDFHFVKLLAWDKVNKICGRYYMGQIEHIIMLRKGNDKPINDCGLSDLLSYPNDKDKDVRGNNLHDSQKPTDLMRVLIYASSNEGDIVLDPFMGSGTTAVACIREKRNYIGYEIDKKYYNIACQRVDWEQRQLTLF